MGSNDDTPNDGISFFQKALFAVGAALAAAVAIILIFSLEPVGMPPAERQPPFESTQALARLTHPIGCDITVERPGRRPGCSWKEEQ